MNKERNIHLYIAFCHRVGQANAYSRCRINKVALKYGLAVEIFFPVFSPKDTVFRSHTLYDANRLKYTFAVVTLLPKIDRQLCTGHQHCENMNFAGVI